MLTIKNYNKLNDTDFMADRVYFVEHIKENESNYWITVRNLMGVKDNIIYNFEINRNPLVKANYKLRLHMVGTGRTSPLFKETLTKDVIIERMIFLINEYNKTLC